MSEVAGVGWIAAGLGALLLLPSLELRTELRGWMGIAVGASVPPVVRVEGVPYPGWYEADDLGEAVKQAGGEPPAWVSGRVADGATVRVIGAYLVVGTPAAVQEGQLPFRALGGRINLNTASQAELESLPKVGPTLARRIIDARPFRRIADLDGVKGIGPKTLEVLRPWVEL